nr:hypothetical protein [Candidatus Sigynarchaeota archaeon]
LLNLPQNVTLQDKKDLSKDDINAIPDQIKNLSYTEFIKLVLSPQILDHCLSDPKLEAYLKSMFKVIFLGLNFLIPDENKALGRLDLLAMNPINKDREFFCQLARKFINTFESARKKDPNKTLEIIKRSRRKIERIGTALHERIDTSEYARLGQQEGEPTVGDILNFIQLKKDRLFDLGEGGIRLIILRLAEDYVTTLETHLTIVMELIARLDAIDRGISFNPAYSLGEYAHFLNIDRYEEVDCIDYRNAKDHFDGIHIDVDIETRNIIIKVKIKRIGKNRKVSFTRTIDHDVDSFVSYCGGIISQIDAFEDAIEALSIDAETAAINREATQGIEETTTRIDTVIENPSKFRELLSITPGFIDNDPISHIKAFILLGFTDQVKEFVDNALKDNPNDVKTLNAAGYAYLTPELRDLDRSLEYLKRVLTIEPSNALALYNSACVLALQNHRDEAISNLEESWRIIPRFIESAKKDPDLESLRNNPQFISAIQRALERRSLDDKILPS